MSHAGAATAWPDRVAAVGWDHVRDELDRYGCALTGPPLAPAEAGCLRRARNRGGDPGGAGILEGVRLRWLTMFLDFPPGAFTRGVAFWREVTGAGLSPSRGAAGEFATLLPPTGDACLRVQRVAAGSGGCHLDLHVDGSLSGAADRAVGLGASVRHAEEGLVAAQSPGGFAFCLVQWDGESVAPSPVRLGDAGDSRADQLCLDIPAAGYDRECSFWSALTGYELRAGSRPEFGYLARPEGIPVRLLLQRLDDAAPGKRVAGHVDFACADRRRLAGLHAAAGARILAEYPVWTVLADPAGREYCLTARDPRTGTLARSPAGQFL